MVTSATRAYRALHPRSLLLQLVVLIAAEAALYALIGRHDDAFRWAAIFFVALTVATLVLLAGLMLTGEAWPRFLLLTILGMHLVAVVTDTLIGLAGVRVTAHSGVWVWVALTASALYVTALTLWLRARRRETDAGMPPGIGLTGGAVLRAQFDPRLVPLASEERPGSAVPTVLLLHGLGATMAFWRPVARQLETLGVPSLTPDLLGFGASIRLGTTFRIVDQAAAVVRLISAHDRGPVLIVAHSYGAAVGVQVAIDRPDLVTGLVLIEPAAFADAAEARHRLGDRSWLSRSTLNGSRAADWACGVMCLLRLPLVAVAPRLARASSQVIPPDVARGAVTFVWPAYRDALASLLKTNPLIGWLSEPQVTTQIVVGTDDRTVPPEGIRELAGADVRVEEVAGTHALPLEHPALIASLIAEAHAESGRAHG